VFDRLAAEARAGYDCIIGLDLDVVAIDGSLHKAPCGGEGTGPSPVTAGQDAGMDQQFTDYRFGKKPPITASRRRPCAPPSVRAPDAVDRRTRSPWARV
jgi:hypothetical protein